MTLIDQRILVPSTPNTVWSILADQSQLPKWRVDCQMVQVLTTRQFGVGMRRRCAPAQGKDKIEEITVWYEGLGYEYIVVESRGYKSWTGRIRLQAVPEGTIVQWTITYEPNGIFNRMMNALGGRAQNQEDMANSLRQLRRLVESTGQTINEARKRQTLQPVPSIVRSSSQPIVVPREVAEAETKPRKPEGLEEATQAREATPPPQPTVPTYAETTPPEGIPAAPTLAETRVPLGTTPSEPVPVKPVEEVAPDADTSPKVPADDTEPKRPLPPGMPESLKVTPPQGTPKVDLSRLRYADELDEEAELEPSYMSDEAQQTQLMRPGLPPPTRAGDTGEISIWDAFGIKPPSKSDSEALAEIVKRETGEMKAVNVETALRDGDTFTFSPLSMNPVLRVRQTPDGEEGLRIKQARERANVRQPKRKEM